ncbi:MAG: DUF1015 family protein [Phycisphaerales bacterium]
MPQLHPIAALRFNTAANADLSTRIAPPYDVLDEQPKQQLLAGDPHNIVAVDLPVTPPKTVGPASAYEAAGATFRGWVADGTLIRDPQPAIYAYEQSYTHLGRSFRRRGFFAGLALEPFGRAGGGIHRHEMTIQGGIDDRMLLMRATAAQLSPVFGIYHDPQHTITDILGHIIEHSDPAFTGTTGHDNVLHRVWPVTTPETLKNLTAYFRGTDVFIADGHHRYTTALNYAQQHPDVPGAQQCLFVLVAVEDPGMIVLPTHRILTGLQNFTFDKLVAAVEQCPQLDIHPAEHGHAQLAELADTLPTDGNHAVGIFDPASGRCFVVTANDEDPLATLIPDKPECWRTLDVAVAHELLIDRVIRPRFGGTTIQYKYTADLDEMRRLAEAAPDRLALILQPTRLQQVCDVATAGQVMPPKSTFFFPKLATGLLIHPMA